jgi:superfamily II DNA helicase RecQ|tara:strand:- start:268 stop:420 length:153 start_codon:yes stop_codon:yes gene_type:complete
MLILKPIFFQGGGKTATFVVPSLMKTGVTVVISPLVILMYEQVKLLNYYQ